MGSGFDDKKIRRGLRRFYIARQRIQQENEQKIAKLDRELAHYVKTVLRLGPGAKIALFDGSGKEYVSEIIELKPGRGRARVIEESFPQSESELELFLSQAILKEQAFDRVLTSAAELGVTSIVPLITSRVVVNVPAKEADKKLYRWEKILQEAAAQSGRVKFPKISYPVQLDQMLKGGFDGIKIMLWEKAKGGELEKLRQNLPPSWNNKKIMLLVGPEGGFEDDEVGKAIEAGFVPVGLGPRVLRAETAAISIVSIIQYLFGDLPKPLI